MTIGRIGEPGAARDRRGEPPVAASPHPRATPVATPANRLDALSAAELLDGCPVPTFVVDTDHVVIHMNRACADLLGIAARDVLGTHALGRQLFGRTRPVLAELVADGCDAHAVASVYGDRCHAWAGVPGGFEGEDFFPQLGPAGRWLCFRAVPLRDRHGARVGAMETLLDISATRRTEAGDGVAATVAGPREPGRRNEHDERAQPGPPRIHAPREPMAQMPASASDPADFAGDDEQLAWACADLCRCIESALDVAHDDLARKADVVRDLIETPGIECRPSAIGRVIRHLLANAAQAIGAQRGTITIRNGCDGNQVWFEIEDTGSGIDRKHLARIFEPFFTTRPVGAGHGLGLSISQDIVRRHHGRITVRTVIGQGSAFRVTLPIEQPPASDGTATHAP